MLPPQTSLSIEKELNGRQFSQYGSSDQEEQNLAITKTNQLKNVQVGLT